MGSQYVKRMADEEKEKPAEGDSAPADGNDAQAEGAAEGNGNGANSEDSAGSK